MSWRSLDNITKNLRNCVKQESLPPPFKVELEKVLTACLDEIAQEIFRLEKRIHDLERRGR